MRYQSRLGAVVLFCAIPCVSMLTPSAHGGVVCYRDDDDSKRSIASKDGCGDSEWVDKILASHGRKHGDNHPGKALAKGHDKNKHDKDKKDKKQGKHSAHEAPDISDHPESPTGPRPAAVIPLPAPVWSGLIGLGTLVGASAVRKVRRLL